MSITNLIFIIVGVIVTFIGILSIFFPGITKIINAPGNERIKSIIAIIIGLILLIIGLIIDNPTN
jgi:hypothetical protein